MRRIPAWALSAVACLLLAACYQAQPPDRLGAGGSVVDIEATGRTRIDLLVVVDNSGSMSMEQDELTWVFPGLLATLFDPPDGDGDTRPDALPVDDLHVGVVSTDMGTGGYRVSTCSNSDVGDDGCFLHAPSPIVADCEAEYPSFLSRDESNAATYDATQMGQDFTCIATLGTNGCGFVQQLEAMRRAVMENQRRGRCNEGFLRDDSLLVLLIVSDENDCSFHPDHPEIFDPSLGEMGHLSLRCLLHPDLLLTPEWFRDQLLTLPFRRPDSIVLAGILGVPPDPACETSGDGIAGCLEHPLMQETIDPVNPTQLIPSCNTVMGLAFPPPRIVQLVRLWHEAGGGTRIGSICRTDWTDTMEGIRAEIAPRLLPECFPRELDLTALDPAAEDPSCEADCVLVEMLHDGSATCPADDACPPEACPETTLDAVLEGRVARCRHPDTGEVCEPLVRDLGAVLPDEGGVYHACLVRQDPGTFDPATGRCDGTDPPRGWRYVPPEWNDVPGGPCPTIELPAVIRTERAAGGRLRLYCGSMACPLDRQCGPRESPATPCCPEGAFCARDAVTGEGDCIEPDP